jgi:dipeptidyl aminopeptidase/acylaminoacyl peptidase
MTFTTDALDAARAAMLERWIGFPELVDNASVTPHWRNDGSSFWYEDGATDGTVVLVEPDTDRVSRLARTEVEPAPSPAGSLAEPRRIRKGLMEGLPDIMEIPAPGGANLLSVVDSDLYVRSATEDRSRRLTDDGEEENLWDLGGAAWSPDGRLVAAYKTDIRGVSRVPIVHWLEQVETVEWLPYPRTGGRIPQRELHIVDVETGRTTPVKARETEWQHVGVVGWLPDGSGLVVGRGTLLDNRAEILVADASSGQCRTVMTEVSETFISWGFLWGCPPRLLPSGSGVLVRSERDGWAHLYHYGLDGRLRAQLTSGEYPVLRIEAVDEDGGWVYFTAHAEPRLYDTHLYRVSLEGGPVTRLTEAEGHHDVSMAPSNRYFVAAHSRVDRAPVTELRRADGSLVKVLAEAGRDRLDALGWRPPEEFTVLAADGVTELRGVMYKPFDFDPAKKYPVLDSIYGGPQMTWVPRRFTQDSGIFSQALAQLGMIVFHVDGRGTPERSKAFQDVVYRNFGRHEIPDHVAALHGLAAQRPYMDLDRVAIYGGSWGGYMALRGMVLAPDVYRAGVALYPNVDLDDHDSGIEAYMGMPEDNPEGYEYASSLKMVDRIKGRLLIMHGTNDTNVTFSCTMKLVNALMHANKPYDLVVLPEQTHVFRDAGRRYAPAVMARFLLERLF